MKHINLLRALLLLAALVMGLAGAFAQGNLPYNRPIVGFRGNIVTSDSLLLNPADTTKPLTVEARKSESLGASLTEPQPVLVRKKLKVVVQFATSSNLPQLSYYRLFVDGQARYVGTISIGGYTLSLTPTESLILAQVNSQLGVVVSQYQAVSSALLSKLETSVYTSGLGAQDTRDDGQDALIAGKEPALPTGNSSQYLRGDKTLATLNAAAVGLPNVNNTSDANKPVSTAQQAALDLKANQATTYTKTETNSLITNKADFQKVDSFAQAKANITTGTPKTFFIANNELFSAPTHSSYDGTNWNHSPALTQNN